MPGVFILVTFPTMLLGAVLVIMGLELTGVAAVSMVLLVILVGVVFVSLAMSMRRQHPSRDGGDRTVSEDRSAPVEAEPDREAIPEEIEDVDTARYGDLTRWTDDGGPRSPVEPV